jgi:stage V sporulation protein G
MSQELFTFKIARINKVTDFGALRAYVDIIVNDTLLIKGLRVIEGKKGLFVSLPQEPGKDNKWYEIVRCLDKNLRTQISDVVMSAYYSPEPAESVN